MDPSIPSLVATIVTALSSFLASYMATSAANKARDARQDREISLIKTRCIQIHGPFADVDTSASLNTNGAAK
jgi:hypothetical protein